MNGTVTGEDESFCIWCEPCTVTRGKRTSEMLEVGKPSELPVREAIGEWRKQVVMEVREYALGRSGGPLWLGTSEESATHQIVVKAGQ